MPLPRLEPVTRRSRQSRSGHTETIARRRLLAIAAVLLVATGVALLVRGGSSSASERLAQGFVRAWSRGEWAQMYAAVDPATRRRLSAGDFAAIYSDALGQATAVHETIGTARGAAGGTVSVPVTVRTRLFGTLRLAFVLPIASTGGGTAIAWSPSLTFPGLRPGETLSRRTDLPPRASLLARDGTPLASLASASGIIGSLGPIPPERAAEERARGFPPGALVGLDGLQRIFDSRLAGTPGGQLLAGTRILGEAIPRPAPPVRTTITPRLQTLAVATLGGLDGGIVVMRPRSGELLAVAGTPFSQLQPPGSTFKIVTLTGVLLAGLARPTTTFPFATTSVIDGFTLHNANDENCGGTLAEAFAVSCNSVFAPLGAKLGARRLVDAAERFGFNRPPPFAGVSESTIPPGSLTSNLDVGSSAIGQGQVQATALQMALVAATIALNGRRPTPTLEMGVSHPLQRVLPIAVASVVTRLMIGVVTHGTGTAAQITGVRVAGKTGTAELATTVNTGNCTPDPSNPQSCPAPNDPRNTDAWFVAFAPAATPRIVVGVLLPHNGAGGSTAAPMAATVLRGGLRR